MEGVALSIGEGMAAGLPVVGTDVGGMSEVVKHGRTGVLVPLEDERGFIDAVVRLARAPAERVRLGAAGRHFITHDYSLDTAVGAVEQAYLDLMRSEA
jgi:glycosyltransferase involved in cell wall biosynthesis